MIHLIHSPDTDVKHSKQVSPVFLLLLMEEENYLGSSHRSHEPHV